MKWNTFRIITTFEPELEAVIERRSINMDALECCCSALVVKSLKKCMVKVLMPAMLLRTYIFMNFEHLSEDIFSSQYFI